MTVSSFLAYLALADLLPLAGWALKVFEGLGRGELDRQVIGQPNLG